MSAMTEWHFLVDRDDYRNTRLLESEPAELGDGNIRVRVDSFGFTANNVTYAAAGDMIGYWNFFPAPDADDGTNWGRVPVWGFADVVESHSDLIIGGDRLFGYFPMSTELVITPTKVTDTSLSDGPNTAPRSHRCTTATRACKPIRRIARSSRPSRCCTSRCSSRRS